jgi:hypothetical protein
MQVAKSTLLLFTWRTDSVCVASVACAGRQDPVDTRQHWRHPMRAIRALGHTNRTCLGSSPTMNIIRTSIAAVITLPRNMRREPPAHDATMTTLMVTNFLAFRRPLG